jgi:hypothetical protein
MKLISAPEFHPLRRRCPDDYPPYYDRGRNQEDDNAYPWYLPSDDQRHSLRIDKILNLMTRWIMPNHDLETISFYMISYGDQQHTQKYQHLQKTLQSKNIYNYLEQSSIQVDIYLLTLMVQNWITDKQVQVP